jgi:hypothetical protein
VIVFAKKGRCRWDVPAAAQVKGGTLRVWLGAPPRATRILQYCFRYCPEPHTAKPPWHGTKLASNKLSLPLKTGEKHLPFGPN